MSDKYGEIFTLIGGRKSSFMIENRESGVLFTIDSKESVELDKADAYAVLGFLKTILEVE
ncbi:hypothetical protein [Lysinibacillus capsici]|uniref:hypothetical protein n=1 Tax=Lysinibacillus capsici TaxID=2115968 RepID=UPI00325FA492